MNMTVVSTAPLLSAKKEITFEDFKTLVDRSETRKNIMSKTLELMQANMVKLDEEPIKRTAPNSEPYVLQAYYNENKTLLAVVRCKKDEARTPEAIRLTSLETSDYNNSMHVYKGPADYMTDMCAFYHNSVTNPHDWAFDAGLLDPAKHKRTSTAAKIA